jgi:hypothetical protein
MTILVLVICLETFCAQLACNFHLGPVRVGDCLLMDKFLKHFRGIDLVSLNVLHQYKKVIHISCLVPCNGITIDKDYSHFPRDNWTNTSSLFSNLNLPTTSCRIWKSTLQRISSEYYTLPIPLGQFVAPPHRTPAWTTSHDCDIIYGHLDRGDSCDVPNLAVHSRLATLFTAQTSYHVMQVQISYPMVVSVSTPGHSNTYRTHHPLPSGSISTQ